MKMKNTKLKRLLVMLLSLALLIGSAVGIAVSAEGEDTIDNTGVIEAKTIVHNDKIQIGFYIDADKTALTDGTFTVKYYWGDDTTAVKTAAVRDDGLKPGSTLVVTEGVAYYELTKVVTVTVYDANEEEVDSATYSVAQFLYAKLYADGFKTSEAQDEKEAAAVYEALIDLGAKSQTYLEENAHALVTDCSILYTDVDGLTLNGERYVFALPGENITATPVYTGETPITGFKAGSNIVKHNGTLSVSGILKVELYDQPILDRMEFEEDVTDGVNLYTQSGGHQTSLTTSYSPTSVNGVVGLLVTDSRNAANKVLKITINGGKAINTGGTSLGGQPTITLVKGSDDGGKIHIIEYDFNWAQAAKTGWRNPFTFEAFDAAGNSLGLLSGADDTQYRVNMINNGISTGSNKNAAAFTEGTVMENAYQLGISGNQNETANGNYLILDSDTWYRIRMTWNEETGATNYSISTDGGDTWYRASKDNTTDNKLTTTTDVASIKIRFNQFYGHGGIMYFDNIDYNVVTTLPTMPTTNGITE